MAAVGPVYPRKSIRGLNISHQSFFVDAYLGIATSSLFSCQSGVKRDSAKCDHGYSLPVSQVSEKCAFASPCLGEPGLFLFPIHDVLDKLLFFRERNQPERRVSQNFVRCCRRILIKKGLGPSYRLGLILDLLLRLSYHLSLLLGRSPLHGLNLLIGLSHHFLVLLSFILRRQIFLSKINR